MENEGKEDDLCICGHTRNYHEKTWGDRGCRKKVTHTVGNRAYMDDCECQRFGLDEEYVDAK